jgi:pyruvate/2-oxoglutarate dehydrogenase complex dihydrolipoamide dehydrogenase (E3) component
MGAIAAGNALLGALWPMRRETRAIPRCIHTDPELARAGFTRAEALDEGLDPLETVLALAEIDRAIIEDRTEGFISVLTDAQSDRILGVTIVGARAGEMIAPFTLAIRERIGLRRFLGLMTAYPGWADAARAAASLWQRDRIPAWTDVVLERWHRFRRR